ncbi:MvdC/MvdD family ATP grasp protein [Vitiosangium sp. GDMCC 1.1324]|uniref:MvdC/MvdD family ATP grasp protein n=1 Tax=Vitiosangium sp. (strain GDMCC 1.1324) TaxID=2138576 RepID=UPI000D37A8D0|nr:MvdC family ATP-grasp ribosomal peptide maturase [Vitiosangium sp. GDMCC 1.1324]PTL79432.1 MvdC family ATP-grasp ribosomal peptide maturase [Vitiosangium sp. GDMCC 1.1324]
MPPARDIVLLLTHSGDHYTVDRVAQELSGRGVRPLRVNTDGFPSELELTSALGGEGGEVLLRTAAGDVRGEDVRSVWLRRVVPPRLDESLEPGWRDSCVRESRAALEGVLDGLAAAGCRFINPLGADAVAGNKPRQLRVAREVGLEVPRTLVTNDAARVRSFFAQVHGHMVAKMLTPLTQSMSGGQPFVYTSAIGPEHLEELEEGLRYSPMVFQERIDKARELRVAVVGGRCLVGAINATGSSAGQVDWRRTRPDECQWTPGELPEDVAARLVRLVAALGLVYGAADFIVTPEGRHVFLEVNPGGEWGMLERDLGLPIAAALADALASQGGTP